MFKKMISIVAVAGLVLTLAPAANAAISVANSGSWGATGAEGVINEWTTVTHTIEDFEIAAHDNDLLVVMIGNLGANEQPATNYLASVKFGGVDMTLQTEHTAGSWKTNAYIYTMAALDVGTTDDIVVVWANDGNNRTHSKRQMLTALHVYGDQPLTIFDKVSGGFDDSGTWTGIDVDDPYYYAGMHANRTGDNVDMDWNGPAVADYDVLMDVDAAVANRQTSRARGHYFLAGNSSDLSVDSPDSGDGYARIAITEVPEPATMSLLAIGGLGVMLKRRRRRA